MDSTNNTDGEQYFLWLSDIHFDPYYSTAQAFKSPYYKNANCDGEDAPSMGRYGCDSPKSLVSAALSHAVNVTTSVKVTPSFIIVSGDSIRHGVDQLFAKDGDFKEGAEGRNNNTSLVGATSAVELAANSPYHTQAMRVAGEILHEVVSMVQMIFPESEIIVSLGNNDVVPDYYLQLYEEEEDGPPEEMSSSSFATTLTPETAGMVGVLYSALSRGGHESSNSTTSIVTEEQSFEEEKKKTILTTDDKGTFLRGGYYSRTLHNGTLTVLSLNTVLYSGYFQPTPLVDGADDDPGGQFSWMRSVLANCLEMGTQAMIVGHIPPSVGSFRHTQLWKDSYVQKYYEIAKEFDGVIVAQLFGHLHSDEFRVGLADEGSVTSGTNFSMIPAMNTPILLGPSITPLHGNDPSIRLVKYDRGGRADASSGTDDGGKYRLLDYDSHRFSIGAEEKHWSKLYTFSDAYSVALDAVKKDGNLVKEDGLTSRAFRSIVNSMEDRKGKESPVLQLYRSFMRSGADGDEKSKSGANVKCDSWCRDELLCTFTSATRSGYDNCILERFERNHSWMKNGRSIFGVVGATLFVIVAITFVIVRCKKIRRRDTYESTPSVTGNGHDAENDDANDQEMI